MQGTITKFGLNDTLPGCKNFTYGEVIASSTAEVKCIDNYPYDPAIWNNAIYLAQTCLQHARDALGVALSINSWYRSAALNKAVGGSPSSFHAFGMAADVSISSRGSVDLKDLFTFLHTNGLYTELLLEEMGMGSGWVHIALARGREKENVIGYKMKGKSVNTSRSDKSLTLENITGMF